ncbi:MAG: tetratricopeptide repeat protein [Flavobacteriales bacterium]|nr:tetratricopeptide repeat protein [Flavobacteriales bacterium]
MKKLTLLISLSLLSALAFSQINITELERVEGLWAKKGDSKPYNGDFKETFEDGKTKGTGTFVDGQLEGLRIQYFLNGNKRTEKNYKDSYPHGTAKEFYENGTLKQVGEFVNNKESGIWTIYYESGEKHVESEFVNGVQQGKYMEFSKAGELLVLYFFRNGKAEYSDEFMELINKASEMSGRFIPKETIELYDKALELNPTVAHVYLFRGTAYSNTFNFDKAIQDYNKALEINPNYMEAYANRGSAKINVFTSKGTLNPTPEQTKSACEDFHKAKELGDSSIGTEDMIYIHCNKNKPKKKKKK